MADTFLKDLHTKGNIVERVEQIVRNYNRGFENAFTKIGEEMIKSEIPEMKRIFAHCKELKC